MHTLRNCPLTQNGVIKTINAYYDHGNPDSSMFESVAAAHKYIQANRHYMKKFNGTKMRADEYGGVYNA